MSPILFKTWFFPSLRDEDGGRLSGDWLVFEESVHPENIGKHLINLDSKRRVT